MYRIEQITLEILNTSLMEWIAVVASLIYVVLMARKKISAWFFAAIGSGVYVYLCFNNQLYLEMILQLFYVAMAVWGFINWRKTQYDDQFIRRWKLSAHGLNILISFALAWILGFIADQYTDQAMPYLDAFTTVFSLAATFMVTQKVLENWIYWIVIDIASVFLYESKELNLTAALFVFYAFVSVIGFFSWLKAYKKQGV
jgi:nicotinamide mononucleotide transporter